MISLLIADDEARTREGLSSLIEKSALPVTIIGKAANGIEALSIAEELHPDVVITDVRMPRMDGIELSFEIRKFDSDCQIIFLSGYSDKEYLKSAIALRAVSYVEKPIIREELLGTLRAAISLVEKKRRQSFLHDQQKEFFLQKAALDLISFDSSGIQLETLSALKPDFFSCSCFYTLIFQLKYKVQEEKNPALVYDCIKNTLMPTAFLLAQKESNLFIVHIGTTLSGTELPLQLAQQVQTAVSDIADSFCAIGSPVQSPAQLSSSYFNAVICLKKLFFTGYNHVCRYHISDNSMENHCTQDNALLDAFDRALKDSDFDGLENITDRLFHSLCRLIYKFESNTIKNIYFRYLLHLSQISQERGISNLFSDDNNYIWESISSKETIFDLHDYLLEKLSLYQASISGRGSASSLLHRIYQYIDEHYADSSLTVNRMADELHFTPAYLCQIFKAQSNMTVNSYIHSFRIHKAKELLKNPNIKLYQVSCDVGYKNPDHFTKQFKKYVGITPSEYREKYLL